MSLPTDANNVVVNGDITGNLSPESVNVSVKSSSSSSSSGEPQGDGKENSACAIARQNLLNCRRAQLASPDLNEAPEHHLTVAFHYRTLGDFGMALRHFKEAKRLLHAGVRGTVSTRSTFIENQISFLAAARFQSFSHDHDHQMELLDDITCPAFEASKNFNRAKLYLDAGKKNEALVLLARVSEQAPSADISVACARLLLRMDREIEAVRYIRQAEIYNPTHVALKELLALIHQRRLECKKQANGFKHRRMFHACLEAAQYGLNFEPNDPDLLCLEAESLIATGKQNQALEKIKCWNTKIIESHGPCNSMYNRFKMDL